VPLPGGTRIVHPHVVIQDTVVNQSRIETVVVCALSTNMKRAFQPGNILLESGEAGLSKQSIVIVSQVSTVEKSTLGEYIGTLSKERVDELLAGMEFLQRITERGVPE
jgi:mRNA interferase MazF